MAFTFSNNSASISTTEFSLVNNSTTPAADTTDCMLQVWIDLANMAAGDQYEIKIKEKINGGSQLVGYYAAVEGAQSYPFISPALVVGEGWDVTMKKLAGTDRTINWSLRKLT